MISRDVIYNKAQIIERCLRRIEEEYQSDAANLLNYTKQDSIILNLQRACEAAIDLAMHVVAERRLGLPQNSRDAFALLQEAGILPEDLAVKMKAMVGFRNIAVHDYQNVNLDILAQILKHHLPELRKYATLLMKLV